MGTPQCEMHFGPARRTQLGDMIRDQLMEYKNVRITMGRSLCKGIDDHGFITRRPSHVLEISIEIDQTEKIDQNEKGACRYCGHTFYKWRYLRCPECKLEN